MKAIKKIEKNIYDYFRPYFEKYSNVEEFSFNLYWVEELGFGDTGSKFSIADGMINSIDRSDLGGELGSKYNEAHQQLLEFEEAIEENEILNKLCNKSFLNTLEKMKEYCLDEERKSSNGLMDIFDEIMDNIEILEKSLGDGVNKFPFEGYYITVNVSRDGIKFIGECYE